MISINLLTVRTPNGPLKMPTCEICGMEVIEVNDCKECEAKYCKECGNTRAKLCYDCLGWENDITSEEDWDEHNLN
jgi:hypothetical protein